MTNKEYPEFLHCDKDHPLVMFTCPICPVCAERMRWEWDLFRIRRLEAENDCLWEKVHELDDEIDELRGDE